MKPNYLSIKLLIAVLLISALHSLQAQNSSFTISFDQDDFVLKPSHEFTQIEFISYGYFMKTEPGEPALPYLPVNFAVPYGAEFVSVEYTYDTVLFAEHIKIKPTQHLIPIKPFAIEPQEVKPLKEIYKSSESYPKNIVLYTSSQFMSSYQFFTFDVSPFMYLPLQNQVYLVKDLHVTVSYNPDPESLNTNRYDDGTFYDILKNEVINPKDVNPGNIDNKGSANTNIIYLIITSDSLAGAFQALADWKNQKGIRTQIVTTEHIYSYYQGATPQLKLKQCIYNYYLNKGTVFVLLGGDINIIPVQRCYAWSEGGDNTIPTDLFYSCFDGAFDWDANKNKIFGETTDNVDLAPEVFITRAPVKTILHTSAFVDKTLNYEQNPPLDNFANEMLNFGVKLFGSWGGKCDAAWKTARVFDDYVDPYWNGNHHSFYDIDSSGTSYVINDSLVKSQINEGYNFLFMTSHGYPQEWKSGNAPFFTIDDVYELNNIDQQGIIVTIACLTNAFDDIIFYDIMTGYPDLYDSCLSEAFLRYQNGGAVAYHGCSREGLGITDPTNNLGPSFLYSANFFKSLFRGQPFNNKYKLGAVAATTKIHYIGPSSCDGAYRWLQFGLNTLGDTELDILTDDPSTLNLACPDSVPLGNLQTIVINTGEPRVNICLSNGEDVFITGVTDNSGNFSCVPSPLSFKPVIVTATAHNKIFATDTLKIGEPEGAVVILDNYSVDANGDSIIAYCENADVSITLKNIGIDTAFNTFIRVFEDDDYIVLNIDSDSVRTIPPGESVTKVNAFNFDVNCYVPDKYSFEFDAIITDRSSQRNTMLDFIAYAPEIEITDIKVQCGSYSTIKTEDSASIYVKIQNNGGAGVHDLEALLSSTIVFMYDFQDSITQLNACQDTMLSFAGYNTENPIGTSLLFILEMNADGYATAGSFQLQVIDSLENFETADFTLYPWNLNMGVSEWIIDSVNAYDGRYCARSGILLPGQKSIIELELDVLQDGYISFYKKTSYESLSMNYLVFYIDSVLQDYWCGNIDWSKEAFPVSAGIHTFKWEYYKEVRVINDSTDCVWIDYIAFPSVSVVSSIEEITTEADYFSIYPNPNNGIFNIVVNSGITGNFSVEIYNLQGQKIFQENMPGKSKKPSKQINLGPVARGIYLIKIQSNKIVEVAKILVN